MNLGPRTGLQGQERTGPQDGTGPRRDRGWAWNWSAGPVQAGDGTGAGPGTGLQDRYRPATGPGLGLELVCRTTFGPRWSVGSTERPQRASMIWSAVQRSGQKSVLNPHGKITFEPTNTENDCPGTKRQTRQT